MTPPTLTTLLVSAAVVIVLLVVALAVTVLAYKRALTGRYAVIAAKNEVIRGLHVRLNRLDTSCDRANERLAIANARLAPFIAVRKRDAKGHFVSAKKGAA